MHRGLTPRQQELLARWLPRLEVVADHSWGLTDGVVLELRRGDDTFAAKAWPSASSHLRREVRAHREWTGAWVADGRASELVAADEDAGLLVTTWLPGRLVRGTPAQDDPQTYRQAGHLLAVLHGQSTSFDPGWDASVRDRVEDFLARRHRIAPHLVDAVRDELADWPSGGAEVVPTHGDFQPRNWLDDHGTVRVIDFGRAALRPRSEDFLRLDRQDFVGRPDLEEAFLDGYGGDPRGGAAWRRARVAEAVGTAVWAFEVGDEPFELVGHDQLSRLFATA